MLIHPFPACHLLCWHSFTWNDTHCPLPFSNPQAFSHFLRMFSCSSCLPSVTYFADNWPEYDSYLHNCGFFLRGLWAFFGIRQKYSRVGASLNPVPSGPVCRGARWTLLQCALHTVQWDTYRTFSPQSRDKTEKPNHHRPVAGKKEPKGTLPLSNIFRIAARC